MNHITHLKSTVLSVVVLALVTSVSATVLTFDDGGSGSSLATADNWNPNQAPTAVDDLVIPVGFIATGSLGGAATPANSVLIQGTVTGGSWALVPLTIDGGSITLSGAGSAFGGSGTADLINDGIITFAAKTASEVVSQYASSITIEGAASVFGFDPLVVEAGDNAYIVENGAAGGDNVTVYPTTSTGGGGDEYTWTGSSGNDLFLEANWTPTSGLTINPSVAVDQDLVVTNGSPSGTGTLYLGSGSLTVSNGTVYLSNGINDNLITLYAGEIDSMWLAAGAHAELAGGTLQLRGAGNPVNASTINFITDSLAELHFSDETVTAVRGEHLSKITVGGVAAVEGLNIILVDDGTGSGTRVTLFEDDEDEDGMNDAWEMQYFGTLDRDGSADFEPDGVSDLDEYLLGTNPTDTDSDGDTLLDGAEVAAGTNPASDDTDKDGLKDQFETLTGIYVSATDTGTDPTNANTDGDRFKDGGEVRKGTDPNSASDQPDLPNVIFMMADDLGYGEVGVYGQEKILTPSLDALAGAGMKFTDMYTPTAVCAPCRGQLMTGKHSGQCFVRNNKQVNGFQFPMPEGTFTLGSLMQNAGYNTSCVGKWGLGSPTDGAPTDFGFDHFFGYLDQVNAHWYYPGYMYRNTSKVYYNPTQASVAGTTVDIPGANNNGNWAETNDGNVHSHDAMTKEAMEWIAAHQDEAFFLYLAFPIPHTSIQPPAHIDDLTDGDGIVFDNTIRTSVQEFYPGQPFGAPIYHAGSGHYTPTDDKRHEYAAMITAMDRDIGRIIDQLTTLGLLDNTLIIFTSDNGTTFLGEVDYDYFDSVDGLLGLKNSTHEGGIREPFIASWPGHVPAGTTSGLVGMFDDVMPTLSELTGVPHPADATGRSILPTLLGQSENQIERSHLYWEFSSDGGWCRAVRSGDLKLMRVMNKTTGATVSLELFDLVADRSETTNLAGNPAYASDVDRLLRLMDSSHAHNSDFFRSTDEFQTQTGVTVSAAGAGVQLEGSGHVVCPFAEVVSSNFTIKADLLTQSVGGLNNMAALGVGATALTSEMLTVEADGTARQFTMAYLGETVSLAYPAEFPTAGTVSVEIDIEPALNRVTLHAGTDSVVHTFSALPDDFGYYAFIVDNARAGFAPFTLCLPVPAAAEGLRMTITPSVSTVRASYVRAADLGSTDICESSTDLASWTTERPIKVQPRNQFGELVEIDCDVPLQSVTDQSLFLRARVE